jgi:hypothetical protein
VVFGLSGERYIDPPANPEVYPVEDVVDASVAQFPVFVVPYVHQYNMFDVPPFILIFILTCPEVSKIVPGLVVTPGIFAQDPVDPLKLLEAAEFPAAFTATTLYVYVIPHVRPLSVNPDDCVPRLVLLHPVPDTQVTV